MHSIKTKLALALALSFTLAPSAPAGPEIPGKPQEKPIALTGGVVHTVSGETIEGGIIVFDKGKITAVGKDAAIPEGAQTIDVAGKHVYPSLLAANSTVGLIEIDSIRATIDHTEAGLINPNAKAQIAVNPDSEIIPVTRANGILLVQASPRGGLLQGQSHLMALDGWTWEDMTIAGPLAVHLNWPMMQPVRGWMVEQTGQEQMSARNQQLAALRKAFDEARRYWEGKKSAAPQPVDLRWEAMIPIFERQLPLHIRADQSIEIQAAIGFAAKENVRIVIVGGYDAPGLAALLKKHDIPVIVNSVNRLPMRPSDPYDAPFTVVERLRQAGVKYCICDGGRFEASSLRNLPYEAAQAVAYGLPADEGLKAITLYPAQILGVDAQVGSLEVGKDATLFVSDGDILEIATNVQSAYVQGRPVDLSNRHKRLFEKYQERLRREKAAK